MSVKYAVISQPMKNVDPDKVKLHNNCCSTCVAEEIMNSSMKENK